MNMTLKPSGNFMDDNSLHSTNHVLLKYNDIFRAIISSMRPHDLYIETHLGTGSVLTHKPSSSRCIGLESDPGTVAKYGNLIKAAVPNAEIESISAIEYFKNFDWDDKDHGRILIYAAPTRGGNTHANTEDHIELLTMFRALSRTTNVDIIISATPSPLYEELLHDWEVRELPFTTHGGVTTEKIWTNYELETSVSASVVNAGNNFQDRQRIKRKAERWAGKFTAMPQAEKTAVLSALLAAMA